METLVKPLPVTPHIKPNESLMSLILRTSEMNGYSSPNFMLRYAGMTDNEIRSARPPVEKLAGLFAQDISYFSKLGLATPLLNAKNRRWSVLGQIVPAIYINVKAAKICPECVVEDHKVDGFWDLKYAIACPKHKRYAITVCPSCKNPLSWHRRGLLTCECGQDLSNLRGDLVEDESILNVLSLIKDKLHDNQLSGCGLGELGYPLLNLKEINFASLIGIISRLHQGYKNKLFSAKSVHSSFEMHTLKLAAGMFANWPHGFYDYLERLYTQKPRPGKSTIFQQFYSFNCSYFKSALPPKEVRFLKEAFFKFGNERWKDKGFANPRDVKKLKIARNFVGINGLADFLGVTRVTAINYVKKGLIKGEIITTNKEKRRAFDLTKLPFKKSEGKYYRTREAAKFICLPAKLLSYLKKQSIYKITRLGWGIEGYSELDLIEFKNSYINLAPMTLSVDSDESLTVKQLLRKKIRPEISSRIFTSLKSGALVPIGRVGDNIDSIVLKKSDALKVMTV